MSELPTVAAIVTIGIVECVALVMGIDGMVLTAVVGALAGLAGFKFAGYRQSRRKR